MTKTFLNLKTTYEVFSVSAADMVAAIGAATSGTVALFTLPANGVIVGYRIKGTAVFAGVAGTLKVQLTQPSGVIGALSADLVATTVSDTAPLTEGALFIAGQISAGAVTITVTSSSGNISGLTAGGVDIYVEYTNIFTTYPYVAFNPNA